MTDRKVPVSVSIEMSLLDRIDEARDKRSRSEFLREIIVRELDKKRRKVK